MTTAETTLDPHVGLDYKYGGLEVDIEVKAEFVVSRS